MHNECIVILTYVQEVQKAILVYVVHFCLGLNKVIICQAVTATLFELNLGVGVNRWMKYLLDLLVTESFCGHHITVASEDN